MIRSGLLFIYVILLGYILFFAGRRERVKEMTAAERKKLVNIVPVKNEINDLRELTSNDPEGIFNYFLNLFGNILLFMPYPTLIINVLKISKGKVIILSAFLVSVTVEMLQFIFKVGVADIDDVLLNTIGAITGLLIYKCL